MDFKITSQYKPTGDQPQAIRQLTEGIQQGEPAQVLLGVTGSGKTFTVANVIANVGKPTLILSHNKTLAAQLYQEMKGFFPENAVEYYVSYYDYYQPEAYLPTTDTPTSRKTSPSTTRSISSASVPSRLCSRAERTSSWFLPFRASTVWADRWRCRRTSSRFRRVSG